MNVASGIGNVAHKMKLLNTNQYLEMRHEAFFNDSIDNLIPSTVADVSDYDINGTWDTTRYTDWQKLLLGGTSKITQVGVSLSGGNLNTQFLIGANYHHETTVYPGDFDYSRAGAHISLIHSSTDKRFLTSFSSAFSSDKNRLLSSGLTANIFIAPNSPQPLDSLGRVNDENGTFTSNPYAIVLQRYQVNTDNLISNILIQYQLLKKLKLKATSGFTQTWYTEVFMNPSKAIPASTGQKPYSQFGSNGIKTFNVEPQIEYNGELLKGKFIVLLGSTVEKSTAKG